MRAVLVTLVARGAETHPLGAPVAVVAPPVVATTLIEVADAVSGRPSQARAVTSAAAARASVVDGTSVAGVVVDLRLERDILFMGSANGDDLNRAVRRLVNDVESGYGRDVVPTVRGDENARGVHALAGGCILLGFVAPLVITWRRGPVAATLRRGLRRLGIVAVSSLLVELVVAVVASSFHGTSLGAWWLIAALTLAASATVTLALESVFGVLGIGVATALLVLSGGPLVRQVSPWLLPEPWAVVFGWLPPGAALEAARGQAYFGGPGSRPVLVLAVWISLAVLTLAVSRRERARDVLADSSVGSAVDHE